MSATGIGDRLREVRKGMKLSQAAFGELGGVGKRAQIYYEQGENEPGSSYWQRLHAAGIDSDFANEPVVQLAVSELQTVGASGLGKDVAAKLSKGQSITLNCTGGGEMVGSPVLDDCTLR